MTSQDDSKSGPWLLAGILVGIGVIWLILLPKWSQQPKFSTRYHELREQGIDPNAMFYTDHDGVWDRKDEVAQQIDQDPKAFGWTE